MERIDEEFMRKALLLAKLAFDLGEAPIGALVVNPQGDVIGRGFNQCEKRGTPLTHAEIIAIEDALAGNPPGLAKDGGFLHNCTLYVTLEPCLMCAGAIMLARLKRVVYGAYSDKNGALSSVANVYEHKFGYSPQIRGGILESECAELMSRFGNSLR